MHHLLNSVLNGPAHYATHHHLSNAMSLAVVLGALLAELVSVWLVAIVLYSIIRNIRPCTSLLLRLLSIGKQASSTVFLELIFPADTAKSAFATQQLHILLRHHNRSPSQRYGWAAYKQIHSLELYSTRDSGIRYVIGVPAAEEAYVTQSLRAYLPGLKITPVEDYLKRVSGSQVRVMELGLSTDFACSLQGHTTLSEHDPMAYLTGHMTKLATTGLIGYQIVIAPVVTSTHHRVMRHTRRLQLRIAGGKEVTSQLATQRTTVGYYLWLIWFPVLWFLQMMMNMFSAGFQIIYSALSSEHATPLFLSANRDKVAVDNPYAGELSKSIKTKLDQHLYEVSIRVLVAAEDTELISNRLESIAAAFQPFTSVQQSLVPANNRSLLNRQKNWYSNYRARTLSPHFPDQQTIVSSAELSDLYHFPNTSLTKTEGLVKSRSTDLAVPLSISRSATELDVIMGVNMHGGDSIPIGMTLPQRGKHTYVIGKTGTGKTTLLTSAIYQDMVNGKGLAVLDPHGDMFQELLALVPEHRRKDVVIFDPSDRAFPVGLNLLDPGIDFADEDEKQERITSSVLSVFAKLADENQWGPRMEHILRNATMTALQTLQPSLYTLQRLLTDKAYQKTVAASLKDPVLKQFWDKEFKLLGAMQLSSVTAPLTHRLGHFITTKMTRHILLQEKTSIRVADIMDEGKILLVNLSKGEIGEDQSRFFGTILTSFIWMAAYQRTKIPEKQRRDFFLYVDEFQNFASPDFSDIVSEGRKYHVALVVSHQSIAQIADSSLVKLIAGNASTLICLNVSPEDEAFILPYMKPEVSSGDIINLAPYHFYIKTTSDVSEDAFSGQTVLLDAVMSDDTKAAVIKDSQARYGMPKSSVEAYMNKLFKVRKSAAVSKARDDSSAKANQDV
jgi:hypothetical protein